MTWPTGHEWISSWDVVVAIMAVGLFWAGFFSGVETGYMSVSRVRLSRSKDGSRARARFDRHFENIEDTIMTCLIGTNLCTVAVTAVLTAALTSRYGARGEGLAVLIASPLIILFGEILPKILYREYPEKLTVASAPGLELFMRIMAPVRWLLGGYLALWRKILPQTAESDRSSLDRQHLNALLLTNSIPATQDVRFRQAMERFTRLGQLKLTEVMRRPGEIVTLREEATDEECAAVAARSGFSRLPLVDDENHLLDRYVAARDLLLWPADEPESARQGLPAAAGISAAGRRSFLLVDAAMSAYELLEELHGQASQLALVVDRAGEAVGVVFLEDLIEIVVGSIQDEFDGNRVREVTAV